MGATIISTAGQTPTGYSITRYNLFKNPSGRRPLTGYTVAGGAIAQDAGSSTRVVANAARAAGELFIAIETMTINETLIPNSKETFTARVIGVGCSVGIIAQGSGVVGGASAVTTIAASGAFTTTSVTFTTTASGTVTFYVLNRSAAASGSLIAFQDAHMEHGATATPYFDGAKSAVGDYSYAWSGGADASYSVERLPIYGQVRSTTPALVLSLSSTRNSRSRLHYVIGRGDPVVTLALPSFRSGTIELFYTTEQEAADAERMHTQSGKFVLSYPERPTWAMSYVLGGALKKQLDPETRDRWVVSVDYQEVAA